MTFKHILIFTYLIYSIGSISDIYSLIKLAKKRFVDYRIKHFKT